MTLEEFQNELRLGIPDPLPEPQPYDPTVNHAPKRKDILTPAEKKLAIRNALRYFPAKHHKMLAKEFAEELKEYGRIYMYRLRPTYKMYARPIDEYPARCRQAAAIMLMIQNNLDPAVAQHPHELITYGGNGAVFQNWAQYRLVMKYLSEMTDEQTLVMYSGHPMGLYPSHKDAPRVVVTNGMMIPNYSKPDDWERYNALGVTQYDQMTAGSYMYIGPQGIVHGTTITVLNAARKLGGGTAGKLFITAGLGGMSGPSPRLATSPVWSQSPPRLTPPPRRSATPRAGSTRCTTTSTSSSWPSISPSLQRRPRATPIRAMWSTFGNTAPRKASRSTSVATRPRSTTPGRVATTPSASASRRPRS